MTSKIVAPYGTWTSPYMSELVARAAIGLSQPAIDGDDLYFLETRPSEKGRNVLVRHRPGGGRVDVTPEGWNVRTRVHEYGGGDYLVAGGTVYFSSFADQRVHRQDPGQAPRPITPPADLRYADYQLDARRRRLICVREDKRLLTSREDVNTIVAVDLDGDDAGGRVLVEGAEFYSTPRLSPDGRRLAWLTWEFPYMPWDAAELWVGDVDDAGAVVGARRIAGGPREATFQPAWSPDGTLHFVSDRSDFWNLYRLRDGDGGAVEPVCPYPADFGAPLWGFGMSTYAFVGPATILAARVERGLWRLGLIDTAAGTLTPIESPYSLVLTVRGAPGRAAFVAGSPAAPQEVVTYDVAGRRFETVRRASELSLDPATLSIPEPIEFPTEHGLTAHGFYYPPVSASHAAPAGERPPLIVRVHGGPTSATSATFSLAVQFWTSRGFAYLDVNYGGSTGYGRAYRERLKGAWGLVDVEDSVNGARHLIDRGDVDGARVVITGGSAGGYTVLRALTTGRFFRTGASHYGISDLEQLAKDGRTGNNHKFESRYEDLIVAPYPERVDIYRERSPIHRAGDLACPVIFFQGLDDRVVLPNQAERMVEVMRAKGLPVEYVALEGEGHGFRRAENIQRVLEAELAFYGRVLGFTPAPK